MTAPLDVNTASQGATSRDLSDAVFDKLAVLAEREAGIVLQSSKRLMVGSRLFKRLRALGFDSFEAYCDFLDSPDGAAEYPELIGVLTTNVTSFFREQHHFDDFEADVLPTLIERGNAGQRVRIWSAGCSIGAEPYSLALLILHHWPKATSADFKILATDIDPVCLRQAQRGVYAKDLVEKEVPAQYKRQFSPAEEGHLQVSQEARSLVSVRPLNLIQPWPMSGTFSTVFCRNVVIYFGPETTDRIWSQFADRLEPGGRLYIGHSERVKGAALAQFEACGVTAYKKLAR